MGIEQTLFAGRFGQIIRDRYETIATAPAVEIEDPLAHERQLIAHHMIPLALMARCDGNTDVAEQSAMFDHAIVVLKLKGETVSEEDRAALKSYIAALRPSLVQLDPALHRLEKETPEAIASLLAAAKNVVMADGTVSPAETHLLDELHQELVKA